MAYVITAEPCIGVKDTACVDACPVDCIHPKKNTTYDDEPSHSTTFPSSPLIRGMHRLWRLRSGLPGVRDLRAGRSAGKVEAVHGTERKLREGRQVHARRVRQAPDREAGISQAAQTLARGNRPTSSGTNLRIPKPTLFYTMPLGIADFLIISGALGIAEKLFLKNASADEED